MKILLLYSALVFIGLIVIALIWLYRMYRQEMAKLENPDPTVWESVIKKFEQEDRGKGIPQDAVLFVGSSSIRFWRKLKQDMAPIPVIQRGFGGSQLNDLIHYADRVILPYHPKAIVLFIGTNDITGRTNDKTPDQVLSDFKILTGIIRQALPETPIYFISMTPTTARWQVWSKLHEANQRIAAFAQTQNELYFLNTTEQFLSKNGTPRRDLLWWDGLHLNRKGYEIWANLLRERLAADLYATATH